MPRLFVAIELPERVRERLALLRQPLPGARWVEAENLHITLRFAGDVDNHVADEIAGFLSEIDADPFELQISDLGTFGTREPRSLWAGVLPSEPLAMLQRATERACRSAGLPPEPRTFKPHVTLARLQGTRPEALARFLGSRSALQSAPFPVERFVLMSSRPKTGGGPYAVEAAFPLGRDWSLDADAER